MSLPRPVAAKFRFQKRGNTAFQGSERMTVAYGGDYTASARQFNKSSLHVILRMNTVCFQSLPKLMKKILLPLMVVLLSACSNGDADSQSPSASAPLAQNVSQDSGEGRLYIDALAAVIEQSERIIIAEHSDVEDLADEVTQPHRPKDYRPVVYASRELSAQERSNFLANVRNMNAATQDMETGCIFEPHHTITFHRANKQTSAMRICFKCGQVEWNGSTKMRPWSLVPALRSVIAGFGMNEKRDWRALAKTTPN